MNSKNIEVLTNIIGGVEAGDQIYGKRNYAAYAAPYANSDEEHTITLGWAQNYGHEAQKLIRMIDAKDHAVFEKLDTVGIAAMLSKDWVATKWNPTAAQKKVLIALIDTRAGHECQDELFQELLNSYIAACEKKYTKYVPAVMMYCEITHLGGAAPANRIFSRLNGEYSLEAIMNSLALDQKDTSNNNQVGDEKYWSRHVKCKEFIEKYAINEEEKSMGVHYISNSGSDENGGIKGGKAGDQTSREWELRAWYSRPWLCILRHPDQKVREKIAELSKAAALNDKIGYDQGQRYTYWDQLAANNFDPSKITVACEEDCSAGVCSNVKAVGYIFGIDKLKNIEVTSTFYMRQMLSKAGFQVLTDKKYLSSPDYLLPGDILLNDDHHTAVNITKGSKAGSETGTVEIQTNATDKCIVGTCSVTLKQFLPGAKDPQIKAIQRILKSLGYKGKNGKALSVDGELGENTAYAIEQFQKSKGMKDINFGSVAATTWKYLLNAE